MQWLWLWLWIASGLVVGTIGVSRPPTLLEQPRKEASFVIDEATMLRCRADGDPAPKYVWYKNGKIFNIASNSGRYTVWPGIGTLIFVRPQRDDDGYYQCVAQNQFGTALSIKTDLRRAEFSSFDTAAQTKEVNRGYSLKLDCRKPTCFPPPKISWRYEDKGTTRNVVEDARHAIDIYGNLNFANVQKKDDGIKFFCVVTSDRIGREEKSKPLTIRVLQPDSNPNIRVTVMANSPTEMVGLLNDSRSFICIFGGNPTPTINWEFVDKNNKVQQISTLPGVRIDRGGVRCVITRVQQVHQGTYRCKGENSESREVTREVKLTVMAKPYWINKPKDAMGPPGSSHTFVCEADGNPKPTFTWTVNGQSPESYINERKRIIGNKFVLTNLQTADTAVIQCNASNSFGYVFADAYINVVREPPTFIQTMKPLTMTAEGQSVILNCSTYSAPPAVVKWTRVDRKQQLTGGRYEISSNGNLRIPSLMVSDTGNYKCEATNQFGSIVTSGRLLVRRRTTITLPPKDVRVYEKSEVKFVCAGSTDPLEVKNLRVIWQKDGTTIDLSRQTRVRLNPADNSLIIGGVRPMDTGSYTCIVTNGIDSAKASASLVVQGRPDQPREVVVDCNTKSAQKIAVISWKAGPDNSAPILKYEIEFAAVMLDKTIATSPTVNTWYPAQIASAGGTGDKKNEQGSASSSAEVRMKSGLQFRFRIRARNIVGISEPSVPGKTICRVPAAAPITNPTNLWAEGTQPDNIIVHWSPMSEFDQGGPELRYKLTIRCLNCNGMPSNIINTTTITNWRDTSVAFIKYILLDGKNYQVEPYKKYKVTIRSKNNIGESQQSAVETTGYSGEGQPDVAVEGVRFVANSAQNVEQDNQVTLRWSPSKNLSMDKDVKGFFRGYRVEWCKDGLEKEACERSKRYEDYIINMPKHPLNMKYRRRRRSVAEFLRRIRRAPSTVTVKLTRLPGNAKLKAWVRILNKRYAGRISNFVTFRTAVGVPGPVENFQLKSKGVTHLGFKWNRPSQTNGNLTGYQMGVQMISGLDLGYLKRFPPINNPSMLEGEVVGLKPRALYRVYIWPRSSAGFGVANFLDIQTSPANVAPGSPTIRVESIGETSINVTFAASQKGEPGSVFYVQYRLPGRSKWEESQREFSRRWILISDLPTDTVYDVRVVATNGAGLTSFSESVAVRTGGPRGPNALAGASATWFIIIICLLLLLIGGIVGLVYLRRWRFNAIQVPTEDPDKMYTGGPSTMGPPEEPSYPPKNSTRDECPMKPEIQDEPRRPSNSGSGMPPYANLPPRDDGSLAPSSTGPDAPPMYSDVQRHSPPQDQEWSRPAPSRRRVMPPSGSIERLDGSQPRVNAEPYDARYASPAPSSAGASVNPSSTII